MIKLFGFTKISSLNHLTYRMLTQHIKLFS